MVAKERYVISVNIFFQFKQFIAFIKISPKIPGIAGKWLISERFAGNLCRPILSH